MRDRGNVGNERHFQIASRQRADRGFSARTGTFHIHFYAAKSVFFRRFRRSFRRHLSRERRTLSAALVAERTRAGPRNRVSVHIGDRNQRVIEYAPVLCLLFSVPYAYEEFQPF